MDVALLDIRTRAEFRRWLERNARSERECWVRCKRGAVQPDDRLWYLDAVEEALCFGWIDSTVKTVDGVYCQRFTRRTLQSNWTELNKERCRRLERLGLMTDAGRAVLPDMTAEVSIPQEALNEFKANERAWSNFLKMPDLYRRVRLDNLTSPHGRRFYPDRLAKLIAASERDEMIGAWNDYGRLLE